MKEFKVYHHSVLGWKASEIGFLWQRFFFAFIWLLVKKLWIYGVIVFIAIFL